MIVEGTAYSQLAGDVLLRRGDTVLLQQDLNGKWCIPGWRLDEHEPAKTGAAREIYEELWVSVSEDDLVLKDVRHGIFRHWEMVIFTFVCDSWKGEPHVAEPHKASAVWWFALEELPSDLSISHGEFLRTQLTKTGLTFHEMNLEK